MIAERRGIAIVVRRRRGASRGVLTAGDLSRLVERGGDLSADRRCTTS